MCVFSHREVKREKLNVASEYRGHFRLPGGASSCFSTGRVQTGPHRFTWVLEGMQKHGPWVRRGAQCRPRGTALFRPQPYWARMAIRLPIPCASRQAGRHCRPVITDDIREVLFQISFPVLPAASSANSTGRITQVAGQAQGMWP